MNIRKSLFLLTALALTAVQTADAGTWEIDPNHSSISFKVRHFFTKVSGEFTNFAGTLEFDPGAVENTKTNVEIDTGSVSTNNDRRDKHLRSDDFFAVEKYPTMTYTSTSFTKNEEGDGWVMEGILNMRGVEKPVALQVEYLGSGPAMGGRRCGFTAHGTLNRQDFGVSWNRTLDQGGMMLDDEVDILIDIEAAEVKEGESD